MSMLLLCEPDRSRYKGREWIMLTGRAKITRAATDLHIDRVDGPAIAAEPLPQPALLSTATRLLVSIVPHSQ